MNFTYDCSISDVSVHDIRYKTSDSLHGSDANHPDPDYSAAYVILYTNPTSLEGHGFTFTIGRGTEIVVQTIHALKHYVLHKRLDEIVNNFAEFWHRLVNDGQLRWLGPEKGVLHLACAAIVNALWDLWAKIEKKPLWKLLVDLTPDQLISVIDFTYISDYLTPTEAKAILEDRIETRHHREKYLEQHGFPAYTTSAGWLGYTDEFMKEQYQQLTAKGFRQFKMKVGLDLHNDKHRLKLMREIAGKDAVIMTDANQRWSVDEAIEWMTHLAEFKPYWIEEPTSPDDIVGHRKIKEALQQFGIRVATGEVCHNRVMFKQFLELGALDVCQIDACRVAGVNEVVAIILMAAKAKIPVCPHAGGLGLCEYVQHYAMFDYVAVGKSLENRVCEYSDHLHEDFVDPVVIKNGCYMPPKKPGFSAEMTKDSIARQTHPS